MPKPLILRLRLDGDTGTLEVHGPLGLWQALLASLGYAPAPSGPPAPGDPEAVQPDELYGGE